MSDYISRQEAVDALAGWKISPIVLDPVPSADVRENVRGEWMYVCAGAARCSICGITTICIHNFCPYCGADMRGGNNG